MQSKRQSMKETLANVTIGMVGSFIITLAVMHTVEDRSLASALTVTLCTVWSLLRGYHVRRYYNGKVKS